MTDLRDKERQTQIGALLARLRGRPLPNVREESTVEQVISSMIQFEHSRILYVVSETGQLRGTISLGTLVQQAFAWSHAPEIHARALISIITARTARDIMQAKPIVAHEEEEVGTVLQRMIETSIKEIPVVDADNRIIGDLTMIDLLKFLSTPPAG